MRTCPNCDKPFESDVPTRLYCSALCRNRFRSRQKYRRGVNARRAGGGYWRDGGYVYLIQEADGGPVKIGWAKNPQVRLEYHQCGNPRELRLIAAFPGGFADEAELHRRFAAHRIRGEWFEPVPELFDLLELA